MTKRSTRLPRFIYLYICMIYVTVGLASALVFWLDWSWGKVVPLSFGVVSFLLGIWIVLHTSSLPTSYLVATVGFPQSGKTTLIVSLFGEAFAERILGATMRPRGIKTIERVNADLERLKKGLALGPTQDQDRFSFRADIQMGRGLFSKNYKTEFGDFPGHDSETYSEKYGPWLHTTEFFKWAADSDAIIFVVDLGRYLSEISEGRTEYIAKISSAFRAAWQNFLDINEDRQKKVRRHPVILVFTKADLFGVLKEYYHSDKDTTYRLQEEIAKLGFNEKTPPVMEIDHIALIQGKAKTEQDFDELLRYFRKEAPNFHVLFTSSFGLAAGKRLGINELLEAVLSRY